jgi:hypothetical protein
MSLIWTNVPEAGEGDSLKMIRCGRSYKSVVEFAGRLYFMNHNATTPHHHRLNRSKSRILHSCLWLDLRWQVMYCCGVCQPRRQAAQYVGGVVDADCGRDVGDYCRPCYPED